MSLMGLKKEVFSFQKQINFSSTIPNVKLQYTTTSVIDCTCLQICRARNAHDAASRTARAGMVGTTYIVTALLLPYDVVQCKLNGDSALC